MHSWKKLQFFSRPKIHSFSIGKEQENNLVNLLKNQFECFTSGRKYIFFGDQTGVVRFVNKNLMVEFEQKLFQTSLSHLYELSQQNFLIAIGVDDGKTNQQIIKIFDLGSQKHENGYPCIKIIKINIGKNYNQKILSITVLDDLSRIVLSFDNGLLLMIFGDLLRDRVPKQHIIPGTDEEGTPIINKVLFRQQIYFSLGERVRVLYCVSSDQTFCYHIDDNQEYRKMVLHEAGAPPESVNISLEGDLILGRDEGVFYFTPENPGSCFGFEGKKILTEFRSYLAVATMTNNNKSISFSVYDVKNKYIALTKNFKGKCSYLLNQWGSLIIITDQKQVIQFEEVSLKTKLDFLFKKKLYNVAIDLASSQQYDKSEIYEMFKRYGDHLENKGDYNGAITQYINTIGQTPPSYVIRKFLDPQRINNLTKYLQALHEKGVANSEHTTLLLNCYTKLKDNKNLDVFIKQDSKDGPKFDVDTAINVLRSSGYYTYSLYLAKKYQENDLYIRIHLEETKKYKTALEYIKTLEFQEAESSLKKYGITLINNAPKETTGLLLKLCTGYKPEKNTSISLHDENENFEQDPKTKNENLTEKDLLLENNTENKNIEIEIEIEDEKEKEKEREREELFNNETNNEDLGSISSQTKTLNGEDQNVMNRMALFGNQDRSNINKRSGQRQQNNENYTTYNDKNLPQSNPTEFIHIFVEHPIWLMKFLERIIQIQIDSDSILYNTLLELYLREDVIEIGSGNENVSEKEREEQKKINRQKAIALLKNQDSRYEKEHALVLVQMYNLPEGVTFMLEQLKFYHEIIQTHIENEDHQNIIESCKKYANKDQNLWSLALNYFVKSERDCTKEILQVLSEIKKENLLSPLMVIQILSQNESITLETIQDYLSSLLDNELNSIEENETNIKKYVEDSEHLKSELLLKKSKAKIFQSSRCSYCNNPLELPSIHFLCGHSIHYRCLLDNDVTCPICHMESSQISDRVNSIKEKIGKHNEYFRLLRESNDGFSVVADHFGRGVLSDYKK
ncbi:vacuolar protein sorting-associated protein 11 [Anaeramoeba flamelloides]|uniref:Vacuolar protein sorting-associated protein 11 homolog n=1 Tax=Anaeramoeba flamelloides TaxID=1746091 RepID=A0AAV7Z260_9EUKA|nr:vacuolar protein sorting-associated protein 11 [Anaeramoeba flamelloides]